MSLTQFLRNLIARRWIILGLFLGATVIALTVSSLVPLGAPTGTSAPSFPNVPLITVLAAFGGLTFGIIIAVLVEMLGCRVRGSEDLVAAAKVPVLAVIADIAVSPTRTWFRRQMARRRAGALQPAE